jgi:hypothetical protein
MDAPEYHRLTWQDAVEAGVVDELRTDEGPEHEKSP